MALIQYWSKGFLGAAFHNNAGVIHCFQRKTVEMYRDGFYAMMHQTSKTECVSKIHHFNSGTWFRGDQVVDQMIAWGDGILKKHLMEPES